MEKRKNKKSADVDGKKWSQMQQFVEDLNSNSSVDEIKL